MDLFIFLFMFFSMSSSFNVVLAGEPKAVTNPFTPKAYLIRYWNKQISNNLPKPDFLISKASPLNAVDAASFAKLATKNDLSSHLPAFCAAANLLCFPDLLPSLEKHSRDSHFSIYSERNFTNYGSDALGGGDSFKNYSDGENIPVNTFRRYSRNSLGRLDKFSHYAPDTNVADQSFSTYATGAGGGSEKFDNYNPKINVPNLRFTSYAADGNGKADQFTSYNEQSNAGDQHFTNYGKNANGSPNEFSTYGKGTNVVGSTFTGYGESGNGANDSFTNYGFDGNVPQNNFRNYGDGGNAAVEKFTSYRDQSNAGDDSFQSYAKNSNAADVNFQNYGKSFNEGTDKFSGYGNGAQGHAVGFKRYGVNNTFKDYAKEGVKFSQYTNRSSAQVSTMAASGKVINRWVEPGKFFREANLKKGTVMPMPDIRDKMPKRSFLPRPIVSNLPFSTSKLGEMKKIFHAGDNSSMENMFLEALSDCERVPSQGESKRCVGSVEDMIDFSTSILGRNIVARSTDNTNGSNRKILIGSVKGINGGKLTKSVSCHQSLYPYLLYYCHSVPKVRVYEADILDPETKAKLSHGVAICHIDTSSWSAGHGAFMALGSGPGKIEVCHWIFENDLTWTTAD